MTFDPEFLDLMPQTCVREPRASVNDYGEPSYGAAETIPCRVVHKPQRVLQATGQDTGRGVEEVVSKATVYTPVVGWLATDRITLPDGSQPRILEVRRYPDEDGDHNEQVLV